MLEGRRIVAAPLFAIISLVVCGVLLTRMGWMEALVLAVFFALSAVTLATNRRASS
jgi:hypothetical protein